MIILLVIDSIWVLGARNLHSKIAQNVQKSPLKVDILPVILFYLLVPLGYVFIIKKLAKTKVEAFLYGLLLGLLMYGTFDLTNKAIFKDYPWYYTLLDMGWGTLCVGIVSFLCFQLRL